MPFFRYRSRCRWEWSNVGLDLHRCDKVNINVAEPIQRRNETLYPDDLKYSEEHEWVRIMPDDSGDDGTEAQIGITHHAQDSLGDVVFVELPSPGDQVTQFGKFGEIESVKAVSDLFSPVSGTVVAVNETLNTAPEQVNSAPYQEGWILKVRLTDTSELGKLMDAERYQAFLG